MENDNEDPPIFKPFKAFKTYNKSRQCEINESLRHNGDTCIDEATYIAKREQLDRDSKAYQAAHEFRMKQVTNGFASEIAQAIKIQKEIDALDVKLKEIEKQMNRSSESKKRPIYTDEEIFKSLIVEQLRRAGVEEHYIQKALPHDDIEENKRSLLNCTNFRVGERKIYKQFERVIWLGNGRDIASFIENHPRSVRRMF